MGDKTAILRKNQLWTIMFLLADEKEQEMLSSPFVKLRKVVNYHKLIGIKAGKDIKKDEEIVIPLSFSLDNLTNRIIIGRGNNSLLKKI